MSTSNILKIYQQAIIATWFSVSGMWSCLLNEKISNEKEIQTFVSISVDLDKLQFCEEKNRRTLIRIFFFFSLKWCCNTNFLGKSYKLLDFPLSSPRLRNMFHCALKKIIFSTPHLTRPERKQAVCWKSLWSILQEPNTQIHIHAAL